MSSNVKALCDHNTDDPSLLSFRQGDIFTVMSKPENGWWEGTHDDKTGLFPPQYVASLSPSEEREYQDQVKELAFNEQLPSSRRAYSNSVTSERKNSGVSFNDEESILPPNSMSYSMDDEDNSFHLEGLEFGDLHPSEKWRTQIFNSLYNEIIPRSYTELLDSSKQLPPYWGVNKTLENKYYYFNIINDTISWAFPDKDNITRVLPRPNSRVASSGSSSTSVESDASDDSDTISDPVFDSMPRRARRPSGFVSSIDNDDSGLSWASVTSNIVLSVHRLNHSIKHGIKWDFIYHSNCIVKSIQQLLVAAGVTDQDNTILNSHALLKAHHTNLLKVLGSLVLASRVASGVWPPPDALSCLRKNANEILLTVRHFVTTAQENGVRVGPITIAEVPNTNAEDVNDGLQTLGELVLKISSDVVYLNRSTPEDLEAPLKLIKSVRRIVLHAGELLALVSSISFHDSPEKMTIAFSSYLQGMYEQAGLLTVTVQNLSKCSNFEYKLDVIRQAAAELECSSYRILIGAKFIQEERDQYELTVLRKEVDRIKTSLSEAAGSKSLENLLKIRPRRAMSMSFHNMNTIYNGPRSESSGAADLRALPHLERTQRSFSSPAPGIRPVQSMETFPRLMYPTFPQEVSNTPHVSGHIPRHSVSPSINSNNSLEGSDINSSERPISVPARSKSIKVAEKPWFLEHDYLDNSIVITDNIVKGGTVESLVERLTSHDTLDTSFIATFLLTYRSFTTTVKFFDLLFRRFNLQRPPGLQPDEQEVWKDKKLTPVRLRVFNIMKTWLETYYNEGEDQLGLENLRQFACTTMNEVMPKAANLIVQLISKRRESSDVALRKLVLNTRTAPQPILPKNMSKLKLIDLDPLEIARQLTIIDCNNYNKLKPTEFLNKAFSNNNFNSNVKIMSDMSNKVTRWVADSILVRKDIRKRIMIMKHLISVMEKCFQLNNFNALMAVTAGFTVAPVFRLKRTWEMLPPKSQALFDQYKSFMDTSRNFAKYREMLHSVDPPCVPFLGLYLTDLTFNDDGNPDYLPSAPHLINFSKHAKTAECIREIQQFQNSPYSLDSVAEIQEFLLKSIEQTSDMAVLYDISLKLEPREKDDEKIARLLHESGFL